MKIKTLIIFLLLYKPLVGMWACSTESSKAGTPQSVSGRSTPVFALATSGIATPSYGKTQQQSLAHAAEHLKILKENETLRRQVKELTPYKLDYFSEYKEQTDRLNKELPEHSKRLKAIQTHLATTKEAVKGLEQNNTDLQIQLALAQRKSFFGAIGLFSLGVGAHWLYNYLMQR